ncbi:hypothetical protein HHK36_017208 [Tetracentron sinense]|uniref:CSC1/OSCA1-like N-terminal transmembrane domain-containing protein n=1 Tax=Tetracentron sinense TaxID=13715 RepID=A0A835DCL8_TETSI|nr:hypothetical protein HHK36_017208 [Tetracentron sinense]
MNAQSLLASAAINTGLALVILSLFSIFKKQPSNASIYYARRLSKQDPISFHRAFSASRFLPSVSWIPRAFRISEDEILQNSGLDALVVIRLFKLGRREADTIEKRSTSDDQKRRGFADIKEGIKKKDLIFFREYMLKSAFRVIGGCLFNRGMFLLVLFAGGTFRKRGHGDGVGQLKRFLSLGV